MAKEELLTPRRNRILDLRYDMESGRLRKLKDVGKEIGVSRERIRQLVDKSLKILITKGMSDYKKKNIESICYKFYCVLQECLIELVPMNLDEGYSLKLQLTWLKKILESEARDPEVINSRKIRLHIDKELKEMSEFYNLLQQAYHPPKVRIIKPEEFNQFRTMAYRPRSTYYSGVFFSRKMNREVYYTSLPVLHFLLSLENSRNIAVYYEFPFEIPFEYEGSSTKCFPHVFYIDNEGRGTIVEILTVNDMGHDKNLKKLSAIKRFAFDRGYGILATDGRHSIKEIMDKDVNAAFQDELLEALAKGPLDLDAYVEIKKKYKVKNDELVTLTLRKKLIWKTSPFSLSL